jgi:hypothetical protein
MSRAPGGDEQVVVPVLGARSGAHGACKGIDGRGGVLDELDTGDLEGGRDREGDVAGAALAERQPDQRRAEQEAVAVAEHGHVHVTVQFLADRDRRGQPAEVAAENQNLRPHGSS